MQHEVDVEFGFVLVGRRPVGAHRAVARDGALAVGDPRKPQVAEQAVRLGRHSIEASLPTDRQEQPEPLIEPHRRELLDLAVTESDAHPVPGKALRALHG